VLHTEQGLGDSLQFIRYAPLVKQRGGTVVVECLRPLARLLARCPGIDRLVVKGSDLPAFDVHASLMSLPALLGTTLATVPADVPYLFADPELVERWRRELAPLPGFKVGIAWQGDPTHPKAGARAIPLRHFEPLARRPGVRLFSLQKGPGTEQLRDVAGHFDVTDFGNRLDEASGPFMDTAAVMKNLDLVITSDTAIAHLAGGLGVPVWVAVPAVPEWRWLLGREDSPWYPTLRLFRQARPGDWEGVFARMATELPARAPGAGLIRITIGPGELLDRISLLDVEREHTDDPVQRGAIEQELVALAAARDGALGGAQEVPGLAGELRAVHELLRQVEEELRSREGAGDFGPRFVELARSLCLHTDRRAALKRRVDEVLGFERAPGAGQA
jgi:hypothetical protein